MSEVSDKLLDQDQELRRRNIGAGDEKLNFDETNDNKPDSLSPADSENEQRLGSDSDHVGKKNIDFYLRDISTVNKLDYSFNFHAVLLNF